MKKNFLLKPRKNSVPFGTKPAPGSKRFDIHDPDEEVLFEPNNNKGKTTIAKMCPALSECLGLEHFTNHQIRATVVQTLSMAGVFSPNDIIKVTDHKSTLSLNNYDPHMRGDKRANMAVAIGQASHLKRGNDY